MREILFRGKDRTGIVGGGWVYGSLDNTDKHFPKITYLDRFGNKLSISVDPYTVGQYIGLTDKNGKQIFEGDFFQTNSLRKGKKYLFCVGFGEYIPKEYCEEYYSDYKCWGLFAYDRKNQFQFSNYPELLEVIGNIHDNPELLNKF